MKICFLKFGGGLITDKSKPFSFNKKIVESLAKQVVNLHSNYPEYKWVIGNGAGSFGHYLAKETNYKNNPSNILAASQIHQSVVDLNSMVVNELQKAGLPAFGLSPVSFINKEDGKYTIDSQKIIGMLKNSIIPIVHGDVILDDASTTSVISTEQVIDTIGRDITNDKTTIGKVVYITSTDGVLDQQMNTIKTINKSSSISIHPNDNFDVTGGMKQKIEFAIKSLDFADQVFIISGKNNNLLKVFKNQNVGTRVVA